MVLAGSSDAPTWLGLVVATHRAVDVRLSRAKVVV
jgi:hypothetical protein